MLYLCIQQAGSPLRGRTGFFLFVLFASPSTPPHPPVSPSPRWPPPLKNSTTMQSTRGILFRSLFLGLPKGRSRGTFRSFVVEGHAWRPFMTECQANEATVSLLSLPSYYARVERIIYCRANSHIVMISIGGSSLDSPRAYGFEKRCPNRVTVFRRYRYRCDRLLFHKTGRWSTLLIRDSQGLFLGTATALRNGGA